MSQENENEINEVVEDVEEEVTHSQLLTELAENNKQIKALLSRNNEIQKSLARSHKNEVKAAKKNKRNKNPNQEKKPSGFNRPSKIPEEFCEQPWGCDPDDELPRTILTKMVYDYIKEHNLRQEDDKRKIITSGEHGRVIRKLFHLKKEDQLEFKNFQTYMARLYKRENLPDYESESEEDTPKSSKNKNKKGGKSRSKRGSKSSSNNV